MRISRLNDTYTLLLYYSTLIQATHQQVAQGMQHLKQRHGPLGAAALLDHPPVLVHVTDHLADRLGLMMKWIKDGGNITTKLDNRVVEKRVGESQR